MATISDMGTGYAGRRGLRTEATGSIVEAACGVAVVVLAIIGLSRADAGMLMPIAVIVLGAGLLAKGGAAAAEFSRLLALSGDTTLGEVDIGSGVTPEIALGAGVLVLGILSLLGVSAATLVPAAVVATGALLLIAAPSMHRLNEVRLLTSGAGESGRRLSQAAGSGAAGLQVVAGLAAIVLGILAFTAHGAAGAGLAANYILVGLLVLGAAITLSASAVTGNMMRLINR